METWRTPQIEEIDMNAEIGGYQGDDGERDNTPPRERRAPPAAAEPTATPTPAESGG